MKSKSPRVLVTGYSGFTGLHVTRLLESRGYEVFGLGREEKKTKSVFHADLIDYKAIEHVIETVKPDYVLHFGALSFVGHEDEKEFYSVNLFGTQNLLTALHAKAKSLRKVIVASSANVYGNCTSPIASESDSPAPLNHYAISKLSMEYMARTWFDGLPMVITRPFNYTGLFQGENFIIPKIVKHFRDKITPLPIGNLEVVREFNDVRMVAEVYLNLMENDVVARTINICTGRGYGIADVLNIMGHVASWTPELSIQKTLARRNEVKRLVGDPSLMLASTQNIDPIPLEETLRWMYSNHSEVSP